MAEGEITARKRSRNRSVAFITDRNAATVVEFALIAAPFLAIIAALIQTFLLFFAQSQLELVVRQSGRQILTGQVQLQDASRTQAQAVTAFHQTVCNNSVILFT